jgi:hypothetical protein
MTDARAYLKSLTHADLVVLCTRLSEGMSDGEIIYAAYNARYTRINADVWYASDEFHHLNQQVDQVHKTLKLMKLMPESATPSGHHAPRLLKDLIERRDAARERRRAALAELQQLREEPHPQVTT